ncbi:class II aldolase/adducin family protein [Virgibacillus dakarensis]|uniref:Class II aldolase n=1 Tax=Lentibacillus populi TaxID=1827502 RepID=A0A9W5X6G0_9BACI|nr:class II aldolase/adducin family protein [Lentibacillus populi]MTW87217.1 class II aldolase/adducin family protein [Virgibacillus dakarensis]GGB48145.1 class II aldolase [Lentibacillus populi]
MNLISKLIDTGNYLQQRRLAWGNSGNMSARYSEDSMIMTGSGTNMGDLTEDDFVRVNIDSQKWEGTKWPSKEIPMHRSIYLSRSDANVIIHASPFWSTLIACSEQKIDSKLFIESMYYLQAISYVDYFHPGSTELGKGVARAGEEANVIFLKNHGVIVFDDSFEEAKMRIETLELACKMVVLSKASSIPLSVLSEETAQDFVENSVYKRGGKK